MPNGGENGVTILDSRLMIFKSIVNLMIIFSDANLQSVTIVQIRDKAVVSDL